MSPEQQALHDDAYEQGTRDPWTLELARREGARQALEDLDQALAGAQASLRVMAIGHLRANARAAAQRCEAKRTAHQLTRNVIAQRLAALATDTGWAEQPTQQPTGEVATDA